MTSRTIPPTSFRFAPRFRATQLRRPPRRIVEWARESIIIPDGPLKGQPFDPDVQPYARLFLEEIDSGRWDRFAGTGPSQQGKSLSFYVIPTLYHCLEIGETVVAGVPTLNMANDKWTEDLLPVIEASPRLAELLPTHGEGSRSGKVKTRIKFRNGATLRFMSAGGSDKTRAGFTARVLAATEVDGYDEAGSHSREADKFKQMEARQRAFLKFGLRTYIESTVSISKGKIWQEVTGGSHSRIARPCPHCKEYVTPDREHLVGWEEAKDEDEVRANAAFSCPACGELWTEEQRLAANQQSVLVHKDQKTDRRGRITGPAPPTRTLGFRFSSVDSSFITAADVALDEWHAQREHDRENAEKELRQFVWAIPYDPPEVELTPLDPKDVASRMAHAGEGAALKKGVCPADTVAAAVAVDTGKRKLHWDAGAFNPAGGARIIEYGEQPVEADRLGVKPGLIKALKELKKYFDQGWSTRGGQLFLPRQVWIDAHYHEHTDAVYEFCRWANAQLGCKRGQEIYRPTIGYGEGQRRVSSYHAPKKITQEVRYIGPQFHLARSQRAGSLVVHLNADHWKSELHQRLAMPPESPLAVTLFESADPREHEEWTRHITAERQVEVLVGGRPVVKWEPIRRENHHLDGAYAMLGAGSLVLALMHKPQRPSPAERPSARELAERARSQGSGVRGQKGGR